VASSAHEGAGAGDAGVDPGQRFEEERRHRPRIALPFDEARGAGHELQRQRFDHQLGGRVVAPQRAPELDGEIARAAQRHRERRDVRVDEREQLAAARAAELDDDRAGVVAAGVVPVGKDGRVKGERVAVAGDAALVVRLAHGSREHEHEPRIGMVVPRQERAPEELHFQNVQIAEVAVDHLAAEGGQRALVILAAGCLSECAHGAFGRPTA
jgi:hypothetical protein